MNNALLRIYYTREKNLSNLNLFPLKKKKKKMFNFWPDITTHSFSIYSIEDLCWLLNQFEYIQILRVRKDLAQ